MLPSQPLTEPTVRGFLTTPGLVWLAALDRYIVPIQVPTELYFERQEKAISSLLLAKDISIPENLRKALVGPHSHHWEHACLHKLHQMNKQGVWQAIDKTQAMKTIGHRDRLYRDVCSYGISDVSPFAPGNPLSTTLEGMFLQPSNSPTEIEKFRNVRCNNFEIKWSNAMKWLVGLECAFSEGKVAISQFRLTNDIFNTYPRKIFQHDCPLPPIPTTTSNDQEVVMDARPFRLVVESLAYLTFNGPTVTHWTILWDTCSRHGAAGVYSQPVEWQAGAIPIGLHAKTGRCTHFMGFKTSDRGGPLNVCFRIYCSVQFDATSGAGNKPTDSTGPGLQEDGLL
ncbi:hypothetical protein O181_076536 [Austropuccinia psidii MF-1]|uniref:Uncharacterized protein n=1 Tax=Austropuccinia psidii MF-1 TaxID=1389203 RepID=A0A9Q3FAK9_9BASI|nr:hypothetical protein [Austropuccinia psidii MF-1]